MDTRVKSVSGRQLASGVKEEEGGVAWDGLVFLLLFVKREVEELDVPRDVFCLEDR